MEAPITEQHQRLFTTTKAIQSPFFLLQYYSWTRTSANSNNKNAISWQIECEYSRPNWKLKHYSGIFTAPLSTGLYFFYRPPSVNEKCGILFPSLLHNTTLFGIFIIQRHKIRKKCADRVLYVCAQIKEKLQKSQMKYISRAKKVTERANGGERQGEREREKDTMK